MQAQKSKIIIAIGFSAFVLTMVIVTLIGFTRMISINKHLNEVTNEYHLKTNLTYIMRLAARERMISLILMVNLEDPFEKDAEMLHFNSLGTQFADARIKLLSLSLTEREKSLLEKQSQETTEVRPLQNKLIDFALLHDTVKAHKFLAEVAIPAQNKVIDTLKEMHDVQQEIYDTRLGKTAFTYHEAYFLFMALLGIVTVAVIAYFVIKRISSIENALFKEKERYALAVRGANDGVWDWDLDNNEVYFSPRWKDMLGYEDHEIENKLDAWMKRIHPDDTEKTMSDLTAHLNGLTYYFENEHRLLHKDGSYRWFLERGLAMRDEKGKAYRIAGSQTDITERKQFERQLQQSEMRMRAVLNNMLDGIITTTDKGEIESLNYAAEQMFGYNAKEMINKSVTNLLSETFRTEYEKRINEFLKNKNTNMLGVSHELMGLRKNGPNFPLELSISEMWFDKQRKFIIIARDISERKKKKSA